MNVDMKTDMESGSKGSDL